jgi:D-alanyl-D-alanine carboxypeptidase/D-alanyl-D-alanine-endopeptidase (penicillin-binding protein 4)
MRLLVFIIIICITCFSNTSTAQGRGRTYHHKTKVIKSIYGTSQLTTAINRALLNVNTYTRVGIAIKSMKYDDTLFVRNAKSLFIPASILKVLTAEAALLYLGPQFKFPTRLLTDANTITNHTLNGNLYLVNSGDPSLTYYDLNDLLKNLKAQQIQKVAGNIYIDNSAYDQVTTGPGWLWNDKRFCYAAPISASIINHNCLSFRVSPTKTSFNQLYGSRAYYPNARSRENKQSCVIQLKGYAKGKVPITNCLSKELYSANSSPVVDDVLQYNRSVLQDLFNRHGIIIGGDIAAGKAASNTSELTRHESKPLYELVADMLKLSDNIIAGSLFKKIGEKYTHRPGTWENGGAAVTQILAQHAAMDSWRMNLIDGSGLSRYNQFTPAQMLRVLEFTFHNKATNYHFISALPIAGVDGTLKRRMRNIAWKIRAKTGTMQGVVSLAGYAMSADKEPLAFVIMINGRNGSGWQYRQIEDKIMWYLTHYSRTPIKRYVRS